MPRPRIEAEYTVRRSFGQPHTFEAELPAHSLPPPRAEDDLTVRRGVPATRPRFEGGGTGFIIEEESSQARCSRRSAAATQAACGEDRRFEDRRSAAHRASQSHERGSCAEREAALVRKTRRSTCLPTSTALPAPSSFRASCTGESSVFSPRSRSSRPPERVSDIRRSRASVGSTVLRDSERQPSRRGQPQQLTSAEAADEMRRRSSLTGTLVAAIPPRDERPLRRPSDLDDVLEARSSGRHSVNATRYGESQPARSSARDGPSESDGGAREPPYDDEAGATRRPSSSENVLATTERAPQASRKRVFL